MQFLWINWVEAWFYNWIGKKRSSRSALVLFFTVTDEMDAPSIRRQSAKLLK